MQSRVHPLDLTRVENHVAGSSVKYTHLDRVVYPGTPERGALLKAHVLDYYLTVADAILPHLEGRPMVFRRFPDGVNAPAFYTKDWRDRDLPAGVGTVEVWSDSREQRLRHALVETVDAVGWLAQTGAVEAHPWLSRLGPNPDACATREGLPSPGCGLDRPDVVAFDMDPYVRKERGRETGGEPSASPEDWASAVEVTHILKNFLDDLGLPAFLKTSGKRGLHVIVPIQPEHPFDRVRAFAQTAGGHLARRHPDLVTVSYDSRVREGRVFLDCNQNVRGKTLASAYSLRPTPGATVSTPLAWRELDEVDPSEFDITTIPDRLAAGVDPWRDLDGARVRLAHRLRGLSPGT